ncbi:cytochrome aa3 quinol oxidase subunit II [Brevibacillus sp. 7WMA2]|uniref:Quinol oxidase subunit 2 n=1 Tax=Brevibacillus laterosporus LMG 15441 TaxID=1042163 RepID=A0A075RAG1_BRELA|nr:MULTISPECIES: cytochrome aa3 quinol oxidase subunit II [Brevibacillus]HAS01392.1 cytochrome aa3 quinol oxidase subunit II [Brevibacillus sp.]AIG28829.1 quinol oxidase subunit 2 precursor [Brevibacillus laterosporus LMG 15441]AUM67145.1 cytochrome aa3 quinol oxidase subunit II [Brevibacillus laterosporus]ERM16924.1 quinol oxidase subunit 2 [Brevibacillus laterosporus PE36]MBA4531687.1 cytochrome aa3 quinol oxidase subunit II [Brevibacillus halotolerans]
MRHKGSFLFMFFCLALLLSGCEPLMVLDPKGPVAKIQSDTIIFSMWVMAGVLFVVYVLFVYMLVKYRATKANEGYVPPHEEGSKLLEIAWTAIPIVIVVILSVITVKTLDQVENKPAGYDDQKPMIIYASSSNWKWHFSYPEENIETVNYLNIPTNRPIEFRLYSYGPITSFWIPQLGGQKYAMSDMVTKLHFAADHPGSFMGKNSNFSGRGFAQMEFEVLAMSPADYSKWVDEVKKTAPELTEPEFDSVLDMEHVGRKTYSSTHLSFRPAPEGAHGGHNHGGGTTTESEPHSTSEHSGHSDSSSEHSEHSEMNHDQHKK